MGIPERGREEVTALSPPALWLKVIRGRENCLRGDLRVRDHRQQGAFCGVGSRGVCADCLGCYGAGKCERKMKFKVGEDCEVCGGEMGCEGVGHKKDCG